MNDNLFELIRSASPGDEATLFHLPGGGGVSYGEVFELSGRISGLLHELEVAPGDRVAVAVQKSWQAIAVYLGTLRAGAAYLPLNPSYTAPEVAYFLRDAEPKVFVCCPSLVADLEPVASAAGISNVLTLDPEGRGSLMTAASNSSAAADPVQRRSNDLAAILYTSGTTGRSKGAMLSHGNLSSNALTLKESWRFTSDDVLLHALPIFHTHGLFVATNTLMLAGGSIIFHPRFDANLVMEALPRATTMMGVPTFYTRLLAHPGLDREATATIRLFISGSAPLLAETHREFERRTGHRILERYGMTETNMITSNPYEGERRPGSVGPPLPGVEVRIADEATGTTLPVGEIGVVEVRGPNVFGGYWGMEDRRERDFRPDGFFITGDLGRIDEDGYVHLVGRSKDLIISGGLNVYPKEIESMVDELAEVEESAVIGIRHPDYGEGVTAVVVPRSGASLEETDVLDRLRGALAGYKMPKRVIFVDHLPRNAMGKVQKNVLRDRFADLYAATLTPVAASVDRAGS